MSGSFDRSRALLERARQSLAGGVSSPFRLRFAVPLYMTGGRGARLTDVDGNEYIDYVLGWGPMILGHAHPALVEAMQCAAVKPHGYGQQHELEIAVAERIQQIVPCAERIAFASSGTEAVQLAFRLARAFTGRDLILKFEGHYHGWIASTDEHTVAAPWNQLGVLEEIFRGQGERIAAMIMEPVMCNSGCLMPLPGYLEAAAEICRRHGALFLLDEVITGFRMSLRGAQGFYGITPDLATFGKAVGGGLPLSVVAGRREILEQIAGGGVVFGGTFNGNPISLAAAHATLAELSRDGGAALERANALGRSLMQGIGDIARRRGVPLAVTGFGTAFALHFNAKPELLDHRDTLSDDRAMLDRFLNRALEEGLHIVPGGKFYVSAAHTERDIDDTLAAVERSLP